jgi:hypothetical protein
MTFDEKSKKILETENKCNMDSSCFFNKMTTTNEYHCFDKNNYFNKTKGE